MGAAIFLDEGIIALLGAIDDLDGYFALESQRRVAESVIRPNVQPTRLTNPPITSRSNLQLKGFAGQHTDTWVARHRQELAASRGIHEHPQLKGGLIE